MTSTNLMFAGADRRGPLEAVCDHEESHREPIENTQKISHR